MESGFSKADSNNLPRIDAVMLGNFLPSNRNFCSSEFRNVKTSLSSRASYGDDAISYVQLKRDGKNCTVKCKIFPEHKVYAKLYGCTLVVDEEDDIINSVQCQDCVASLGGCKHAIAFLMWVHRRSSFVRSYEQVANSGDGVFRPPKGLRHGLTTLKAGTENFTCPPKHGSAQLIMPLAVTHPSSDRSELCLTLTICQERLSKLRHDRRSEEPSCTSVECYWRKSKLSRVGSSLKYMTAKDLSEGRLMLPANSSVLMKFLEEGHKRKINNCELLKYQTTYCQNEEQALSMHQFICNFKEKCVDAFLKKFHISPSLIQRVEKKTREQSKSSLWFELRYGRITASKAFEVSRCKTTDGTLLSLILGGKIPDTTSMKHGRLLEDEVRKTVEKKLKKKINKCGLILNSKYPMIAGSPDGIFEDSIIEIKCPINANTFKNYIQNGKAAEKYCAQMQLQIYLTGKKNCFFCIADPDYSENQKVEILSVPFNIEYVENLINNKLLNFWKINVYPLLYQSVEL